MSGTGGDRVAGLAAPSESGTPRAFHGQQTETFLVATERRRPMGILLGRFDRAHRGPPLRVVVPLLVSLASPLAAQAGGDAGLRLIVVPEVRTHFHRFETGLGLGGRAGLEARRWSMGLAAYRFVNDIDSAPAPQHTLSPETPLVKAEHFQGIGLYGLYGSRVLRGTRSSRLALDLLLGAVSYVRRAEAYEFFAFAPDGTPVSLGDIGTGLEVNGFVEPSVRYDLDLGRGVRMRVGAGYQWSTRSWSGYERFDAFTMSAGVATVIR